MITDEIQLRPRYGEVDRMGYVYHANFVNYCHQARTELLRKHGINDNVLEDNNIMLPVISITMNYLRPSYYDELLSIRTIVKEMPQTRFNFSFIITNENGAKVCNAKCTVVFVDAITRKPMKVPKLVKYALEKHFLGLCLSS
jgi:acyl-CoA thioester hydrolase